MPLTTRGDRLLDVVATAGGTRAAAHETYVTLLRDKLSVRIPMQAILADPAENVYVRPGDVISVARETQTFTSAGATGQNAVVPFEAIGITLDQAIARSGGLNDYRADPAGVFVIRYERPEDYDQLGFRRRIPVRFPGPGHLPDQHARSQRLLHGPPLSRPQQGHPLRFERIVHGTSEGDDHSAALPRRRCHRGHGWRRRDAVLICRRRGRECHDDPAPGAGPRLAWVRSVLDALHARAPGDAMPVIRVVEGLPTRELLVSLAGVAIDALVLVDHSSFAGSVVPEPLPPPRPCAARRSAPSSPWS